MVHFGCNAWRKVTRTQEVLIKGHWNRLRMDFAPAHKPRQEAGVRTQQAEGDTGLLYAGGSHRDFALPFWRDMATADLEMRGYRMATHGAPPCMPVAG